MEGGHSRVTALHLRCARSARAGVGHIIWMTHSSNSSPVIGSPAPEPTTERGALLVGVLGDLGRLVVTDMAVQGRHLHEVDIQVVLDLLVVGLDANGAVIVEGDACVAEQFDGLEHAHAMTGLKTLSWKLPWEPAKPTVASLPKTLVATMVMASTGWGSPCRA